MTDPVRPLTIPAAHHARGLLLMLASTACFTVNVLLIRALGELATVNVWLVSCVRFIVGLGVVSAVYWHDTDFRRLFTRWRLAGRGIVGGLGVYGFYLTVVHLGAGRATFINNTYVIFGALIAVWVLRERFRPSLVVGGTAALAGLALLTNAFAGKSQATVYDLLAVVVAFGSAYVVVTIRQLHAEGEHTATIFAAQCVYGILICTGPVALHLPPAGMTAWILMLIAGGCAAVGQIAMTRAFRDLPVAEGSLLQMLVPLGIAAGGFVFFHEHFAPHELIGAALILAGTTFTALRR
jgi:drug/metabolite transporter (DMT)-like permease